MEVGREACGLEDLGLALQELAQKQTNEEERSQVVRLEGFLEAIFGGLAPLIDHTGIVGQDSDALVLRKLGREVAYLPQLREIGDMEWAIMGFRGHVTLNSQSTSLGSIRRGWNGPTSMRAKSGWLGLSR